jgi:hypothetical protein
MKGFKDKNIYWSEYVRISLEISNQAFIMFATLLNWYFEPAPNPLSQNSRTLTRYWRLNSDL